jgi:hypothetical protein
MNNDVEKWFSPPTHTSGILLFLTNRQCTAFEMLLYANTYRFINVYAKTYERQGMT